MPLSMELGKNDFSDDSDKPSHCWVPDARPYASHAQPGTIYRENVQFCCFLARFTKLGPVIFPSNILHIPSNTRPPNPQRQLPWDIASPTARDSHRARWHCRSHPGVISPSLDLVQPCIQQLFVPPNHQSAVEKVSVSMKKEDSLIFRWSATLNLKDVGSRFVQRQIWMWGDLL